MKTESNIKPSVRFEIESLPKKEGESCTVIFYQNVSDPIEREDRDTIYSYDRYALETTYRENLEASVEANYDSWLAKAIAAEDSGEDKTEIELLQEQVALLKNSNEELNTVVDDLIIASLGGDDLV